MSTKQQPSEYTGVCICHGTEVTGRPSLAKPEPYFTYAIGGGRVLVRKIIELTDGSKAHFIPSEPMYRPNASGRKH